MKKKKIEKVMDKYFETHFTTEELAERYDMHPKSVANWRLQGAGPKYVKVGKRIFYKPEDVEMWEAIHYVKRPTNH